jgi:DNA-binding transcriptional regulator YdaS (Cro superfamily)
MTLNQYLLEKDISIAAFGRDLGVSNTSVWKWVHSISLPSGAHMIAIHKMTDGAVTSADWVIDEAENVQM